MRVGIIVIKIEIIPILKLRPWANVDVLFIVVLAMKGSLALTIKSMLPPQGTKFGSRTRTKLLSSLLLISDFNKSNKSVLKGNLV